MSQSAREADKDRIVESLDAIVQALLGNVFETIRRSVNDLGVETERRFDALREETKGSLDTLRTEMLSADESVKREAITAVESRTDSISEKTRSRLENTRRDLDQRLGELEDRLQKEHLAISERLDGAERDLMRHAAKSGRITEVLDSLGNVLSHESAPREAATLSPDSAKISVADPSTDHDGMQAAVALTFSAATKPSMVETQPVPVGGSSPIEPEEMECALDRVALKASTPTTPHDSE